MRFHGDCGRGGRCFVYRLIFVLAAAILSCYGADDVDVVEGQSTVLQCRFDPSLARANPAYYWIRTNVNDKDNVAMQERTLANNYKLEFDPGLGKYDLRISSATYDLDNGKFECKLKEDGSGKELYAKTVKLTVLIPPKAPEITPSNPTVTEGDKVDLVCSSVGGSPPPDIIWLRKGESRALSGSYVAADNRKLATTNTYTLTPGKDDDGAEFICQVTNRALQQEQRLQSSIRLDVNYLPRFKLGPHNPLLVELKGAPATVTCDVDAKPPPTFVRWTRGGDTGVLANERSFVVRPQSLDDAGAYYCEAGNGIGVEPARAKLVVDLLYGPIVNVEPQHEVDQGATVSIECNVTSNPPPSTVEWLKEGDEHFRRAGAVLRLDGATAADTGRYVCRAVNALRRSGAADSVELSANATAVVSVRHQPGRAFVDPERPVASDGDPFAMTCGAEPPGAPEPTYKWWKEGSNVTLALGAKYAVASARAAHQGTYHCKASNVLGDSSVATVVLRVYEPPRLMTQLSPQAARRTGDVDFTINCSARGNPTPRVRWLKNGADLESNPRYVISTHESAATAADGAGAKTVVESVLRFDGEQRNPSNQLTPDDAAHYTCQFENDVRQAATTMLLRIEHAPIVVHPHDKVAADLSETAALVCQMRAYPAPHFEWRFNGVPLDTGADGGGKYETNVTKSGGVGGSDKAVEEDTYAAVLLVHDVAPSDLGDYECRAANGVDETSASMRLQQKGAPETPTDVEVVEVGDDYAAVRWKPGFDGGYVNTTFSVHGNRSGAVGPDSPPARAWDCQHHNPCNLTSLERHTSYVIGVQAHNFAGHSGVSARVNLTTRVDAADMPQPFAVEYDRRAGRVDVRARVSHLDLVARLDVRSDDAWVPFNEGATNAFPVGADGRAAIALPAPDAAVDAVRVALCLASNPETCGAPQEASVSVVAASLSEPEIAAIAVGCAAFALLAIAAAVCYCYRRGCVDKTKNLKKDYEMEAANARPKVVTPPSYRDGIVNKAVAADDDGADDPDDVALKNGGGIYAAHHGVGLGGAAYSYLDHHRGLLVDGGHHNNGSIDSQDSLWIRSGGVGGGQNLSSDRPYPPYDPGSYLGGYPDDYHAVHEDAMNQRNRADLIGNGCDPYAAVSKLSKKRSVDHMEAPYRDVSGLPDPYMLDEDDHPHHLHLPKVAPQPLQHVSLSFDESLESGYSTPNSRTRRVIREIIV